jgi:hypothetical protein
MRNRRPANVWRRSAMSSHIDEGRRADALESVRAAAHERRAADERFQLALVSAIAAGASLRAVAAAAGLTHGRISQLVGPVTARREGRSQDAQDAGAVDGRSPPS